jgi:hypothetical protein
MIMEQKKIQLQVSKNLGWFRLKIFILTQLFFYIARIFLKLLTGLSFNQLKFINILSLIYFLYLYFFKYKYKIFNSNFLILNIISHICSQLIFLNKIILKEDDISTFTNIILLLVIILFIYDLIKHWSIKITYKEEFIIIEPINNNRIYEFQEITSLIISGKIQPLTKFKHNKWWQDLF